MDFAQLLKAARKREGLSQSQAAAAWGVSLNSLQNWEQGRASPSGRQLAKLWQILIPPAAKLVKPKPRKKEG